MIWLIVFTFFIFEKEDKKSHLLISKTHWMDNYCSNRVYKVVSLPLKYIIFEPHILICLCFLCPPKISFSSLPTNCHHFSPLTILILVYKGNINVLLQLRRLVNDVCSSSGICLVETEKFMTRNPVKIFLSFFYICLLFFIFNFQ